MSAKDRERFLEKKISGLERRLVLVERYVEMRFCETFRDFSIRNLGQSSGFRNDDEESKKNAPPTGRSEAREVDTDVVNSSPAAYHEDADHADLGGDSLSPAAEDEEESTTTYCTRSGRKSKRLTTTALGIRPSDTPTKASKPSTSTSSSAVEVSRKVLRVSVTRVDVPSKVTETKATGVGDDVDTSIVKVNYDTGDEGVAADDDDNGDEYFTFPSEHDGDGGDGDEDDDGDDSPGEDADQDDEDWQASGGDGDDDYEPGKKRKSTQSKEASETKTPTKRKRKKYPVPSRRDLLPEGVQLQVVDPDKIKLKECPFCHQHWKPELFDVHLTKHLKERHLKCKFCDKLFFRRSALNTHQRLHQLDKYGKKCRLCDKKFLDKCKVLTHEQVCIRRHLEAEKHVDPEVIEDVRQRSKNVDLKWPDSNNQEKVPEGMKKCVHCKRLIAEDTFKEHLKTMHATWKCNFCDRTYVEKSGLVRHLCNAHGNNRITCELCKNVFESRELIRAHNEKCRQEHKRRERKKEKELAKAFYQETTADNSTVEGEEMETSVDNSSAEAAPATEEAS